MPYGVAKGRTGDPHSWVSDRLADDLGIQENPLVMGIVGHEINKFLDEPTAAEKKQGMTEGSCNMTMEGEYCPEHGLMECGSSMGGAVGMPYSMGEGTDDPINYNAAMTGSYYEGKETDIQEGDALLARIKSLALLR